MGFLWVFWLLFPYWSSRSLGASIVIHELFGFCLIYIQPYGLYCKIPIFQFQRQSPQFFSVLYQFDMWLMAYIRFLIYMFCWFDKINISPLPRWLLKINNGSQKKLGDVPFQFPFYSLY